MSDPEERGRADGRVVGTLAARAIDVLVSRRTGRACDGERWICALRDAVVGPDPEAHRRLAAEMLAAGIPAAEICDLYVPTVARRLGDEWCEDTTSFADVSIGSARLQALLRDVALDPGRDPVDHEFAATVMVLADPHHTLGAMVLTGQLRRLGASVRLVLGAPDPQIGRLLGGGSFDAVLVSVARADDFGAVKRMVTMLREASKGAVPFVVGGGILEIGPERAIEAVGADLATSDPGEVLRMIGTLETMRPER